MDLTHLRDKRCTRCSLHKNAKTVCILGNGSIKSPIVFVGEAPGRFEDKKGKPFVGKSGKLLDKVLKYYGVERSEVYVTNVVKCRPPNNRPPEVHEIYKCQLYLRYELYEITPRVIVPMGNIATGYITGVNHITKTHGKVTQNKEYACAIVPIYHPAYVLRFPNMYQVWLEDIQTALHAASML